MNFHANPMKFSNAARDRKYWDDFYRTVENGQEEFMPPSQFAAFCCSELKNKNIVNVQEIASGDGRDTYFFANHGFNVHASEKSTEAVNILMRRLSGFSNVSVSEMDAVNDQIFVNSKITDASAYYARFFLHVLNENDLIKFFKKLARAMKIGDYFFVEYRNEKDAHLEKMTPEHFRAFHRSAFVASVASTNELSCIYEVEGRGFAKWKNDDAFVTRQIFEKKRA